MENMPSINQLSEPDVDSCSHEETMRCFACAEMIPVDAHSCKNCGVMQLVQESPSDALDPVDGSDPKVAVAEESAHPSDGFSECVACSALLPQYAKFCLICGASQGGEIAERSEDAAADEHLDFENASADIGPEVHEAPICVESEPVQIESAHDRLIREISSKQKKLNQDIGALERDRFWWKKYF